MSDQSYDGEIQAEGAIIPIDDFKRYLVFGWGVILVVFGGLVLWSIFAPFEGAVLTSGQIAVESNQQAIQHLEGGIVRQIYVREADKVEAGQKLISLDATTADAGVQGLEARLFELLGTEARLLSERDNTDQLKMRSGYAGLEGSTAMALILNEQETLREARARNRSTQITILRQRLGQLSERISGMQSEIRSKDAQIALLADEISRFEELMARGNTTVTRILALQRDQERLKGEKDALTSDIAATRVQMGETQSEITRLDQGYREDVLTQLREVQTQIGELSEQRITALDRQGRLDIVAPRSGRVIGVRAHTIGGVISPSEPVMYIVPENDRLVAKVRIMLSDIDQIHVGQAATLRFAAFNQDRTPQVDGTVTKISADAIADPNTGMPYYEAIVEIPVEALDDDLFPLLPGMPVDAAVRTESRSVLSYLVKPLSDSVSRTFREE
tara:strand:- start:360 stop:1694 length:1335 start_codon:yes stop_codon:yes gene_type:complete